MRLSLKFIIQGRRIYRTIHIVQAKVSTPQINLGFHNSLGLHTVTVLDKGADTRKAKHGAKHGAKHDAKREAKHEAKLETLAYTQGKTKRNTLLSATWVRFPVGASFLNLIQEFFFTFLYRIYKFYVIYIQFFKCASKIMCT